MAAGGIPLRVAFAGTPEFAVPALEALADAGVRIPLVLTQPDRPAGRGRRLKPSPVKRAALERGLRVAQPRSLAEQALPSEWGLAGAPPDLLVVVAYGLLLPGWMLDWPRSGCINVHASLLPRWRGAAPIQHAVLAGDEVTGVSLMRLDAGLDTGPVYARRQTPIGAGETAGALHDRLAVLGADLLTEMLPRILDGSLEPAPQPTAGVTYAPKIAKHDARLDFRRPAAELARQVRAYQPWPIAFAVARDGHVLRVHDAIALPGPATGSPESSPGRVVATSRDGIDVAAGDGVLRLVRVQPASSRVMDAGAYLAAHSMEGAEFV